MTSVKRSYAHTQVAYFIDISFDWEVFFVVKKKKLNLFFVESLR